MGRSVEAVEGANAEEEVVATSWKGKAMDELFEAFRGKFKPSDQHVLTIKNIPWRKDELFQHLKDRIPPSKNPEFLQELCGYNDVNAVVPSNGYNVFLKRIRRNDTMIVFQR